MTVKCLKPGCVRTWVRDPALEVPCPTCGAKIGRRCKRPSGHRVFAGEPHDARDIAADQAGHYGVCPSGRCGLSRAERPQVRSPAASTSIAPELSSTEDTR